MSFYRNFPGRNIHSMKKQFERMYDEFVHGEEGQEEMFDLYPAVNVEDAEKNYIFTIELPGVKKEDVKIVFQDNKLIISGEKREDSDVNKRQFSRREREFGEFYRKFSVSSGVKESKISADFSEGLLIVKLPKDKSADSSGININIK